MERGIKPFLREALVDPASAPPRWNTSSAPTSRLPHLGYNRPGFTTPDDSPGRAPAPRPSFTSPDYTSPDFGGPERQSE
ncbi:hypothetical protein [Streptomyces sp. XD-27]|uniref:hypothetical protein n=1 Tax=Streptomyces sp. XD-27 TaxID=3062779 RepID=UPI0026F43CFA|nr:hypothetical protein [Streptomyces sp. XD-27]WKX71290.1 hypothetical protein Q3Y56_16525 [Streptomyces sp. XD-27]